MDLTILLWIQNHLRNDFFDKLMPVVTALGNDGLIWIIIAVFLITQKKYRNCGVSILIALIITSLLGNYGIKPLIGRERPYFLLPDISLLVPPLTDFSFPSGHAMSSFSAATVIFRMNKRVGAAAFFLAFLIAFSRLYLLMHYPTDVFAGAVLGVLIGLLVCWGVNRISLFHK